MKENTMIEIIGKEYQKRLVPVKVQVKQWSKCFIHIDGSFNLAKIWDKRRCFICHGKFKDSTNVTVAITDKGNKLICEGCSNVLPVRRLMKNENL